MLLYAGHFSLCLLGCFVSAAGHGSENRRAQRAGLCRAADLHRPIAHIRVYLHHQGALFSDAAAVDDFLDRYAVFLKPIDDRQGPEGRGLDQCPVHFRRRGVQCLPHQETGKQWIDQNRAIAVVPIERQQSAFARQKAFRVMSQISVCVATGRVLRRRQILNKPIENITDGRLARLESVHAWNDRTRHDAAKAWDIVQGFIHGCDHRVTGAGADDFYERARLDPCANRAHVGIERADGHG